MSRKRDGADTSAILEINAANLRDHGSSERIERVWDRLDRSVVLGPAPKRKASGRWSLAAVAVAAGFALGVGVSGWLWHSPDNTRPVVMGPAQEGTSPDVFAAGTTPRSYPLPGGGVLTLEPGAIVDTVSHAPGASTLRLVRGEAMFMTPAGVSQSTRLALVIGNAQVTTSAGRMHVRHDGDTAYLRVLEGSAEVKAPDQDNRMKDLVLGPNDDATLRVRVITASVTPEQTPNYLWPPMPAEETDSEAEAEEPAAEVATTPDWVVACRHGDDLKAVELLKQDPSSQTHLNSPELLLCISTGYQSLKQEDAAVGPLERIVTEFADDKGRAVSAALALASIYGKRNDTAKAQHYTQLANELMKGSEMSQTELLRANQLCNKIISEAVSGNTQSVLSFAERYRSQFPNGGCTQKIDEIVAAIQANAAEAEAQQEAEPPSDADDDEDPYADDEQSEGDE